MEIDEIKCGEGEQLEFKRDLTKDNIKWLKTVVALANGRGGRIIFGVDSDLSVVGVTENLFATKDAIADAVANRIEPLPPIDLAITTLQGKPVIVLDVEQGRTCPYYLKSKGPREGVYVRYDATTRVADDMTIRELTIDGSSASFDRIVCRGLEVSERDISKLCRKMATVARNNARTDEQRRAVKPVTPSQLVKWGVLVERGKKHLPTWGYVLLSGNSRLSPLVKCAVFKGPDRDIFVDRRQFDGSVQEQIEKAVQYVLEKINMGARFHGVYREDVYEIPPDAIRELIVNAVVHRSYVDGEASPITIALHPDRLEITSPGGLPRTMTLEKMMQGYSNCRNKALAEAFVYMNIIENWGSGIRRVKAEVKKAGLAAPEYTVWPNAIRVCLRRTVHAGEPVNEPVNEPVKETVNETVSGVDLDRDLDRDLDDLEKKVMRLINADCNVTYAKLSEQCGCSIPTVQRRICSLQKKGLIHRVGPDKGGHWEVC